MELSSEDILLQKILLHHVRSTEIWLTHAETDSILELKNKLIEAISRVREFNLKHSLDTFAGLLD